MKIEVNLRDEQLMLLNERKRFAVRVCHRRMGKSFMACVEVFVEAMTTSLGDFRGYLIAPSYKMGKRINWDIIKSFARDIPGVQFHEQELRADFPNGSRITIVGVENADTLRGIYADAVVIDEAQLVPESVINKVIRPILADRQGRMVVQGTPAGKANALYTLYKYACDADDPEWSAHVLPVTETNVLPPNEVKSMQRRMSQAEYEQELLCSFDSHLVGAYYSREMRVASEQGRISSVKYDVAAPVYAALDLGWSDLMVAAFIQRVGTEHHFIGLKVYQETKLTDMLYDWKSLPYGIDRIIAPHDADQHELQSGTTRAAVMRSAGYDVTVAPRPKSKHEAIDQVRRALAHCWFDKQECDILIEALNTYRSDYDELRQVQKLSPIHDWSSHYADAVQTYVLGMPSSMTDWSQYPSGVSPSKSARF